MNTFKTYETALQFLMEQLPMYQRMGAKAFRKDLSNINALDDLLDHPHHSYPTIHIAGTNGKGTVGHMITSVLMKAGYKTGLYTSPHYKDFRERIKIDGVHIKEISVLEFVNWYTKSSISINASFFELSVAMAFWYFQRMEVDIAVIETGLGGRLDSTNIIVPILAVITNIGYDHTNFLGDNLPSIAREKAGIIKENIPVVIGQKQTETAEEFKDVARLRNSKIIWAEDEITIEQLENGLLNARYRVFDKQVKPFLDVSLPSSTRYQLENLRTSIVALQILASLGFNNIEHLHIVSGLANFIELSDYKGRWQILDQSPLTIADSAHNLEGIAYVVDQLNQLSFESMHIVWGMVKDKDPLAILNILPKNARYYFARANIPRGMDALQLKDLASQKDLQGSVYESVADALLSARETAKEQDLIFIGGSVFVVAEVI